MTPLSVGWPQEVIDKTLTFRENFGDYQRQLFLMDHAGLPLKTVLEQLELLGGEVIPVLRKELEARRGPGRRRRPDPRAAAWRPSTATRARQPRPNANRGDNVTGASPYQDTRRGRSRPSTRRCSDGGQFRPARETTATRPTTRGRHCSARTRR